MNTIGNDNKVILRVALATPVRRCFDYLSPQHCDPQQLEPGVRVQVPFGRAIKIGVLVEIVHKTSVPHTKLKAALAILDYQAVVPNDLMDLLVWASQYYQYALGEVISAALPAQLRKGKPLQLKGLQFWRLSALGESVDITSLTRAPRQAVLMQALTSVPAGLSAQQLNEQHASWRPVMKALVNKGWVVEENRSVWRRNRSQNKQIRTVSPLQLNTAQAQAVAQVTNSLAMFGAFLIDGVTGSGKTEVYLKVIETVIERGWQALVLVPEIGLTPQLVSRFKERLSHSLVVLHSGLNDQERMNAWIMAQTGQASVVIGTRSAVFSAMPRLGVIIVDEEHDTSFKQQDGFRYSARDIAVRRAHSLDIPVMLGSATPSLETLNNAKTGRYHHLVLAERAGAACLPAITVVDLRSKAMFEGISQALLNAITEHLGNGNQVLLFLNRRGYAPTLLCHDCGWVANCDRCDSHLTLYNHQQRLRCHHCAAERPVFQQCPACQSQSLVPLGEGTERIEKALQERFPEVEIIRVDRDSTRRKGTMQTILANVHEGSAKILIGTQMLAKGHHFPNVTLVGVLGVDHGLFSVDFRASERLAQLIVQVIGRAGRGEKPGQVLIQSHHPQHPLLMRLIETGYHSFADEALHNREQAKLPPFSYFALLRAEAVDDSAPYEFLDNAKSMATTAADYGVNLFGPVAAPMERRAGKYRAQLLLQANTRANLQQLLTPWIQQLEGQKSARKVRWSIDVDPVDMY